MKTITSSPDTTASGQLRPRMHSFSVWAGHILRGLLMLLIGLVAIGASYQLIATAIDRHNYPPPGQLIDVGGYQLHISCVGQGSPTVIMESGLANMSADWANVQPLVAEGTRVCAYDRAGIAWSDAGSQPRDPRQIAAELHTLLAHADIAGPYVLVGHSFGGLYVRMYADRYPGEVAGMVLLDASHPDMWDRLPAEVTATLTGSAWQGTAMRLLARLGIFRLTNGDFAQCGLPAAQCEQQRAFANSISKWDTQVAEMNAPERDAQVRTTQHLGARPLVVLTAGDHRHDFAAGVSVSAQAQFEGVWRELQAELAALSSNSVHRTIDGAGHSSLQFDNAYAPLTSAAILDVVEAVRLGRPLAQER